jgi:signal transduction histidine kinase/ActR/RegA family two-component response regulator
MTSTVGSLAWRDQPHAARSYVSAVVVLGVVCLVSLFPLEYPRPLLFAALLAASCLMSTWKVNLPIALSSGSTLSVSYAANLMSLLLLGPRHAMVIAVAGVWLQCTTRIVRPYPRYRTLFSVAAEAITMAATGFVYVALGGARPFVVAALPKPLVGAIATYFIANTGLVAAAIALTTDRGVWSVWRDEFQWSGASFIVAGTAGAVAAVVIDRGNPWIAVLMTAPVYLTYRSYQLFVGRLEDQRRHMTEVEGLHAEAVAALSQARAAERALADAHRVKDQFLAIVSHELRTPLNAILGWSEMLQQGRLDAARQSRAFRAIYDGARRQSQLIEDLLDVSRIMSGKLHLARATVEVHDIVRAAIEVVQPAADAKRIHVAVATDASVGAIEADGARLQQIVWNLLANAIKFTPEGGLVHIAMRRDGRFVELAVSDTGQGISADFLKVMFEPFRQADASTTRLHGGLGLGLAIVKQLVEAHGGTIRAESGGEGNGSTFIVRLPAAAEEMIVSFPAAPDASHASGTLRGMRVLVVDDDPASREVITAYLESDGATVLSAESSTAAFEMLQREPIDLLLADIAMPGEDGYDLLRRIRALNSTAAAVPAIALTAFARPEDREHARQCGFQMHLAKPVDRRTLVEAITAVSKVHVA